MGAVASVGIAVAIAWRAGSRESLTTLLLTGYALSFVFGAAISLLIALDRQSLQTIFFWELGSVAGASWPSILHASVLVIVGSAAPFLLTRQMDAFLLGETAASHLGVPVAGIRLVLIGAASLLTAAAVSLAGIIGFVGLVGPHAVRRLLGESNGRLLPAAAWTGGAFVVASDTVARSVPGVGEIPLGVVTALVGGPLFIWLLVHHKGAASAQARI